jgi:lipoate---protein ligase
MHWLDLTLPTPAENLACEEALLDACEAGELDEVLRFWEPRELFVVVGHANEVAREVDLAACQRRSVPVYRRCTGGGTVLQGPGCLNYALVLRLAGHVELQSVTEANRFILRRQRDALAARLHRPVEIQGITDLTTGTLKFSGNAQRRKRDCLLFHGTFLLELDLAAVEELLHLPSRSPDYRRGRSHQEFLTNLKVEAAEVKDALRAEWNARDAVAGAPHDRMRRLVDERYGRADWNLRR